MRILCLGMYGLAEGELSYEARMVHHLAALGNDVDYWTDAPLSYALEPVLKQPPTLRNFVFHEGKKALAKTPRQLHPLDIRKMLSEVAKQPYQVILSTAQTGIDMGVPLKQILGIPLVVQVLDVPYWRITDGGPWELYKESVVPLPLFPQSLFDGYRAEWDWWFSQLKDVDLVATILEEAKKALVQLGGVPAEKVRVTWHGSIDIETFDHYLGGEEVERKNQVLCLNRIDFHKGVDQTVVVCKYIQDILERQNAPVPEFVFVSKGNQPWYEEEVKNFAKSQLKKVRFTGWVDNPAKIRLIRESRVLLDNEWPNGFGGCCLAEALYCRTQPFAWDTPSKKEVHPSGVHLIPKGDMAEMAKEAAYYLVLKQHEETAQKDRDWTKEFRSNEAHAKSMLAVLQEALEKPK